MSSEEMVREERNSIMTSGGLVSKSVTSEQLMEKLYLLVRKGGKLIQTKEKPEA